MKHKGFSVVELLIYMGILTGFLLTLTTMFFSILETQLESEATSAVEQDSRFVFSRLAYDIGRADSVTTPLLGAQGNTLVLTIGTETYTYAVNGGNFELTTDAGSDNLNSIGTSVSGFSVQRLGNTNGKHTLRIAMTLTSATERVQGAEVRAVETTLGLR